MEREGNQEQELLFKQLTYHFMKEQLEQLKENKKEKNRSYVYLESNTLNMLLVYLLMHVNANQKHTTMKEQESELIPEEISDNLDSIITNNKENFEEILSYLKKIT
ncbi:hypothetical protein [Halalkalibacter okhensis]|uniref:Uncharacterized protein n=1 Tax=Halalkalibacter okhensis TaxID=333138 RepID=A0A0B0IGA8_9BACI|nr:hypothetical protein [Halalkalibacter okhensis]KHF39862.1 hypothetical protein LQ50_12400 [Halalkalibacter okhensis]